MIDQCFIPFTNFIESSLIPDRLNDPFASSVPTICKIAASEIQKYLVFNQADWKHNFGLCKNKGGLIKGKMFGVLVVQKCDDEIGYLCTYSGKLKDEISPKVFVPSLFDISTEGNFLSVGMPKLTEISNQIKTLEAAQLATNKPLIEALENKRRAKSYDLQQLLFDQYHFLNPNGKTKGLCAIFEEYNKKKPPSAAGECAAPKLLHYAYKHALKPLAIAEFWWGQSTKSAVRKHKSFYPACNDKCRPILNYMLSK